MWGANKKEPLNPLRKEYGWERFLFCYWMCRTDDYVALTRYQFSIHDPVS